MAFGGGLALKSVSWFLRIIEFCCAAIILGIFSYFLSTLHNHDLHIATYIRAVEGISGAAVVYTILGLLLVCFLGGIAFFSVIGMIIDLCFTGAFIYVAWALRGGAHSCSGNVNTPFGSGNTNTDNNVNNGSGGFTRLPSLHTACQLEKASFSVAIVALVFFFLSIFVEVALIRHRRKERAFGPSPNNGYTAGSPKRRFWQRKPKNRRVNDIEKNPDALPTHATPADVRTSYATDATAVGNEPIINKYGNTAAYGNQTGGIVGGGPRPVSGSGYQTTTTTHIPHDGYTRNHQPYNANPTANF
ncbi:hypothetical protein EG329_001940 [Mollisiaceae sp. DMI_Dod_QoI]|nr:hypothetical protein EG329_001940 [Helotiales sp. DMI_Dod_QoI]